MSPAVNGPGLAAAAEVLVRDYMAVAAGEHVLITADTAGDAAVRQAILTAAELVDAQAAIMLLPQLPFQGRLADPYVTPPLTGAVLASDVWIDLTSTSPAQSSMMRR